MKIIPLCLLTGAALFLAGCTGNLKLVEDGKLHPGTYDQVSKTLQIDIDGVPYKGTFVQGATAGFGTSFSGAKVTTGSMVMTDGSGQALLTSPTGKVLRCVFGSVVAWRGQGQCRNNEGKVYDLLIGQ